MRKFAWIVLLAPYLGCTIVIEDKGVDEDNDGFVVGEDCNDRDASIFPGAEEICDGYDNNCDDQIDEGVIKVFYPDHDEDGFGDRNEEMEGCEVPEGHIEIGQDCNDVDPLVSPLATEVCDEIDNDCNDLIDDDATDAQLFYEDVDLDGYAGAENSVLACIQPEHHYPEALDCRDNDDGVYPGATEVCDGYDTDCSGTVAETLVPDDYSTLQDAIHGVAAGGWVCARPGTYKETLTFPTGKSLTVESTDGPDSTIIDADGASYGVTFDQSPALFRGFIVSGADQTGVYIFMGNPVLENLLIEDNQCYRGCLGSGLVALESNSTLTDVTIRNNTVDVVDEAGYGVAVFADGMTELTRVHVLSNSVTSNETVLSGGILFSKTQAHWKSGSVLNNTGDSDQLTYAGGVASSDSRNHIHNLIISGNEALSKADAYAGGIAALGEREESIFQNLIILDNTAKAPDWAYAGGLTATAWATDDSHNAGIIELINCTVVANRAEATNAVSGAATMLHFDATVSNSVWSDNLTIATSSGFGAGFSYIGDRLDYTYNNAYNNTTEVSGKVTNFDYYQFTSSTSAATLIHPSTHGNLSVLPEYMDLSAASPSDWNLQLKGTSKLIDAGDSTLTDADGTRADIGAYGGTRSDEW
jgi:hypothetical protein